MNAISIALAGLQGANAQFEQAAAGLILAAAPMPSPQGQAVDVVDLSSAAVAMLEARTSVQTNIRIVQSADEMNRTVLDVLG